MAKKKNGKSNGETNGQTGFSKRNKSLLGYNSIFTPDVIDDIHIKAELGRYRKSCHRTRSCVATHLLPRPVLGLLHKP